MGEYIVEHPRNEWRRRDELTASMVDYQVSTPTLNGGAAEQPKSFEVVAKAIAQEEEEEAKTYQKCHPVKGCQNGWRMSIACRHPDVPAESPVDGSHGKSRQTSAT